MKAIRLILLSGVFGFVFNTCIEPFTPEIDEENQFIVINAVVTDEEGYQYAEISKTSSYNNREYNPLNNCKAKIIDNKGNEFEMENYGNGKYKTWIEKQYLQTGDQFKIEVVLDNGNGKKYESEFDTLLLCPEIDSIYFEYQDIIPDDPIMYTKKGIQFYIDFDASGSYANNYRWKSIETWEYHSIDYIYAVFFGVRPNCYNYSVLVNGITYNIERCGLDTSEKFLESPVIDSLFRCWKTAKLEEIFTYTLRQKKDKKVIGLPINLVTNEDDRLTVKYSILVKQLTISDLAFKYWDHLQSQSHETGGLYETQPYELEGNIRCIDNENETVIGIFSASSVKTKRCTGTFSFDRNYQNCNRILYNWEELNAILTGEEMPKKLPMYLMPTINNNEPVEYIDQSCLDCRLRGGTTTEPDYW